MKKRLVYFTLLLLLAGFPAAVSGCDGPIKSPSNSSFIIRVSGQAGTEFTGFCTHEVKYLIGSRTQETDINGTLTTDKPTQEFIVPGIEISCKITSQPGKPITAILFKDGAEVARMENVEYAGYFDWYPEEPQPQAEGLP
jgi:hypothetical protein